MTKPPGDNARADGGSLTVDNADASENPHFAVGLPVAGDAPHPEIVVVGSINADLMIRTDRRPGAGETVLGRSLAIMPGGKGANQAVAAARRGARVALVGAVGDDPYAEPALAHLRSSGVDLAAVAEVVGESTGVAVITVDATGDNSIIVIAGANGTVSAERVDAVASTIASAPIVVLQMEIPLDGVARAAALARGRLIVNLAPVVELDPAILLRADPLVVNEHEAATAVAILTGVVGDDSEPISVPSSTLQLGDEILGTDDETVKVPPEQSRVARLLAAGVPSVVCTIGARGALVGRVGEEIVAIPSPRVEAVDTTGAGDAFVGALAHELAQGTDLVEASRRAARVAAFSVQRAGAQPSYPGPGDELPV